jgi:NADPH:quinone reductase-like Zn-dependent oxidoreductase
MRALTITRPGGPEVLELCDVPDPVFGPEEVLVRVRASALNRADLLQRRGLYPAPPGAPADIPGLEFAGEIAACGELVTSLQPGDRVMGIVGGGGQAQKLRLHERLCLRIPPGMSFENAAAVPEAFLTAYDALFFRGKLRPGEAVLLHAAGSGVGTAAAVIATVAGASVIALSRSAEKRAKLSALGAHHVLDPELPGLVDDFFVEQFREDDGAGPVEKLIDDFAGVVGVLVEGTHFHPPATEPSVLPRIAAFCKRLQCCYDGRNRQFAEARPNRRRGICH